MGRNTIHTNLETLDFYEISHISLEIKCNPNKNFSMIFVEIDKLTIKLTSTCTQPRILTKRSQEYAAIITSEVLSGLIGNKKKGVWVLCNGC